MRFRETSTTPRVRQTAFDTSPWVSLGWHLLLGLLILLLASAEPDERPVALLVLLLVWTVLGRGHPAGRIPVIAALAGWELWAIINQLHWPKFGPPYVWSVHQFAMAGIILALSVGVPLWCLRSQGWRIRRCYVYSGPPMIKIWLPGMLLLAITVVLSAFGLVCVAWSYVAWQSMSPDPAVASILALILAKIICDGGVLAMVYAAFQIYLPRTTSVKSQGPFQFSLKSLMVTTFIVSLVMVTPRLEPEIRLFTAKLLFGVVGLLALAMLPHKTLIVLVVFVGLILLSWFYDGLLGLLLCYEWALMIVALHLGSMLGLRFVREPLAPCARSG